MSATEYPAPRLEHPHPRRESGPPRLRERVRATNPPEVWAVIGLIALATAIRILVINDQSFWMDESLTAYEVRLPFGAMLNTVAHVETTPPLYFVLIWGWAKVFGTSEIALRSLSTLAGIALVPIAFSAGRELVSRWAGVLAAAFVAINPFLIWYSQEARVYMLLAALSGASFLWFVRARREPSRRNLLWWAGLSALALTSHFFAGFLVAPEALWLLWIHRTRAVLVAVAVVAAVQVAMLPFALADTTHGTGWIAAVPRLHRLGSAAVEWAGSLLNRRFPAIRGLEGAAIVVILLALLVLLLGDRVTRQGIKVAGAVAGFVIVAPIVLGYLGQDYFLARNEIPAFVPLAIVLAAACTAPRARLPGAILALALLAFFTYANIVVQTDPALHRPNWRLVARALGAAPVTRMVVAAAGATADPLKIYLPGVSWVQPQGRRVLISEVDVVGARKRSPLAGGLVRSAGGNRLVPPYGSPEPRAMAPRGARLLSRVRVANWTVARFALVHPEWITIRRLIPQLPRFFRRTPIQLLAFVQRPLR
jgi:4-amino-4-deoxy-L-arabinose transferase-like glycosyltransferase